MDLKTVLATIIGFIIGSITFLIFMGKTFDKRESLIKKLLDEIDLLMDENEHLTQSLYDEVEKEKMRREVKKNEN